VRQDGFEFELDFGKVYWNSRLQGEHSRLVETFTSPDDIVCDMFAGIGPFAVPAADRLRRLRPKVAKSSSSAAAVAPCVYANDLNPDSYESLKRNGEINCVSQLIESHNLDAREFVQRLVQRRIPFTQVIMNLPASAVEFLRACG